MEQPRKPNELKRLTDRELMEAVYRAIYGEEPVHAGIAERVKRLERGFWVILALVIGFEGITKLGLI